MTRVTLRQVAAEAGVSVQTVSNVLNNRTQQTWPTIRARAARVRDIADRLGYRPNGAARAMRSRRSMQIGALMRNYPQRPLAYLAAFEMVLGINARLQADDYVLALVRVEELSGDRTKMSRVFQEHLLDGMIVVSNFPQDVCARVEELSPATVWLESNRWQDTHCLHRDDRHAGTLVAEQAIAAGYRKLLWIGPHPDDGTAHDSVRQRYRAVETICRRQNVELDLVVTDDRPDPVVAISGLAERLRAEVVVVAYDSLRALAVSQQAAASGLVGGRDYGLVCCDEEQMVVRAWPGLSRVGNDRFALGYRAGEMMLRMLEDSQAPCPSEIVRGNWIQGNTLRRPTSG